MLDSDDDLANVEMIVDREVSRGAPLVPPVATSAQLSNLLITGPSTASSSEHDPIVALTNFLVANERRCIAIAFIGFTQHGKTELISQIFGPSSLSRAPEDEARGMTTQCRVCSASGSGSIDKTTYFFSVTDTPGDPAFVEDVRAGLPLSSTTLLCVDAVEGFHPAAREYLRLAQTEQCKLLLVITKIDRLITELRLPPRDAYKHLKALVDTINVTSKEIGLLPFSVTSGDVLFASSRYGAAFTVPSIAERYALLHAGRLDPLGLARRLWGPVTFDAASKKFVPITSPSQTASFVEFVLAPLYKVFSATLSGNATFSTKTAPESAAAALRHAIENTYGKFGPAVVDWLVAHCPTGADASPGRLRSTVLEWCARTNTRPPSLLAVAPITAFLSAGSKSVSLARVEIGELRLNQVVTVLSAADTTFSATIRSIAVGGPKGLVALSSLKRGVAAFLEGLDGPRESTFAYLIGLDDIPPRVPINVTLSTIVPRIQVALEPTKIEHTSAMEDGLRKLVLTHPGCSVHVEDSGEHILTGTGEIYLDVALYDLRTKMLGPERPLRLSDPYVALTETVSAPRGVLRSASAVDKGLSISIVAAPMPESLTCDLEKGRVSFARESAFREALVSAYKFDELAAEGVLALGPDPFLGPNILIDDTLSAATVGGDGRHPETALRAIINGFHAACRRGPVCGEMLRGVVFTVVELEVPASSLDRSTLAELTSLTRNVCRAAFLSAAPRLMEPYVFADITTRATCKASISESSVRRRGNVTAEIPLPSTPFCRLQCVLPLIDSFGFDSEVRLATADEALCVFTFAHWSLVPGDPLDDSVSLLPLQAATGAQLARDFALKTRRKKGLTDAVELV